jgi:hypothetical protein
VCDPPQGATCPTTAGNCYGIGKPCPNGASDCQADGLSCANALDSSGPPVCISVDLLGNKIKCTPGMKQCGAGASCCTVTQGVTVHICTPNQCLPQGCTAE